jgi:hypothetical protein
MGARFISKLPHFEISVKLRIFDTHIDLIAEKNLFHPINLIFLYFLGPRRYDNKEKVFSTLVLQFFCPVQIQLLEIENPKTDSPYCTNQGMALVAK